ncbi:MAG: ABC transporter ATP-binding protein [Syntrophobacteraceae bacterium]
MIEITNLTKVFNRGGINEVVAVRSLDCSVSDGDFITVIGSNGSGKSTFLNLLAGTYPPDEGSIKLEGKCIDNWPEHRRAAFIGRVFQNPLLGTCASMSVEENLALAARRGSRHGLRRGVSHRDRASFREKLSLLELGLENRLKDKAGLLSGGQRQSLTLLMATLQRPKIVLLDEHTAALDPPTAARVLALTKELIREMKLTALMVTHNMHHAIELGTRLLMMHQGSIMLDVSGEEKQKLKVQDLLNEFARLKGEELTDDRVLLV